MRQDKVIYTDGRDVTVTDSTLKVKKTVYNINGITKLSMWTIHPDRWPSILLILLGATGIVCGLIGIIPDSVNMETQNGILTGNVLFLWVGVGLLLFGVLIVVLSKERYAVHIETAEGEKNAIVSYRREYIAQIVDAMNRAFNFSNPAGTTYVDQNVDQTRPVIH